MRRRVIEWPIRLLVLGSLLLPGCLVNQNTRMPQPRPRHPRAERRSFEFHDPFPSAELGPVGGPRPPGMTQPRTEARRAMEQRAALVAVLAERGPGNESPAGAAPGGSRLIAVLVRTLGWTLDC